jgi:hypothetical protein
MLGNFLSGHCKVLEIKVWINWSSYVTFSSGAVGGLPLPKVLKNITNMLSSIIYYLRKLRL